MKYQFTMTSPGKLTHLPFGNQEDLFECWDDRNVHQANVVILTEGEQTVKVVQFTHAPDSNGIDLAGYEAWKAFVQEYPPAQWLSQPNRGWLEFTDGGTVVHVLSIAE